MLLRNVERTQPVLHFWNTFILDEAYLLRRQAPVHLSPEKHTKGFRVTTGYSMGFPSSESMENPTATNILSISASQHLTGHPIDDVIRKDWQKADEASKARFHNSGFDIDPTDVSNTLRALRKTIKSDRWDGLLVGWCLRGHVEFTELFEEVVSACVDEVKSSPDTKIMFCSGPDNLFETTVRNFPEV